MCAAAPLQAPVYKVIASASHKEGWWVKARVEQRSWVSWWWWSCRGVAECRVPDSTALSSPLRRLCRQPLLFLLHTISPLPSPPPHYRRHRRVSPSEVLTPCWAVPQPLASAMTFTEALEEEGAPL